MSRITICGFQVELDSYGSFSAIDFEKKTILNLWVRISHMAWVKHLNAITTICMGIARRKRIHA